MCDLVFHCDRVPGHVNAFDWSKRSEGLSDGVLSQLIVNGAHVNSTHDGQSSLTLGGYLSTHTHTENQTTTTHLRTTRTRTRIILDLD